jgi:hypothetical protein
VVRELQLETWAGRWVAVNVSGKVCCDAASLTELLEQIRLEHIEDVEVLRAPNPDDPILYGLG